MNTPNAEAAPPANVPLPEPDDSNHEDFRIHDPREVLSILREIIERRSLVTLHHGAGFIITSLLSANPATGEFLFDCAQDSQTNDQIASARRLKFVALVDNIKTEFAASRAQASSFEGGPAFRVALPDSVLRLQRRNHFRVRASRAEPLACEVPVDGALPMQFVIDDLSVGGVAMLAGPDFASLTPGEVFNDCRIDLPEHGVIVTSLEVRSQVPVRGAGLRVGCRFMNLSGTVESMLQRYINHLERARRALL